jgi:hypothetical protein
MLDKIVSRINNWLTRFRKIKVKPENLLLLFPHCLQWSECKQNIVSDINNCKRCGKCRIGDLANLAEKLGVQYMVASGGRQAAMRVKQKSVKAIVAVACEKEIREGVLAVFPKPVIGVINLRPKGPCVDTDCNMEEVEAAIRELLLEE